MANSDRIQEKLQTENRVYLTQISTDKECVIAGEPQGCERVIESLGCDAFRAPFNHVIHCEALKSEYDELIKLNTLPLRNTPEIGFYSAANYGQMELESQKIAHNLTQTLIQQLDFPRLVERVYQDDYRIFIEVGAGSNCSRWIKNILKSQAHATISLHRRNTDDFTSLIKALAKLVSHRVKLDLSPLYPQVFPSFNKDSSVAATNKPVDLWQEPTESDSISLPHLFKKEKITTAKLEQNNKDSLNNGKNKKEIIPDDRQISVNINSSQNEERKLILWQPITKNYQALKTNNTSVSQAHSTYIDREKTYLTNTQKMLQTQIDILQKAIK